MWDWINCHLAKRHEFVVWNGTDRVSLRCLRCGHSSPGWQIAAPSETPRRHRQASVATRHGLIAGALSLLGLSMIGR